MPELNNLKMYSKANKEFAWRILLASGFFFIGFAIIFALPKSIKETSLSTEFSIIPMEVDFPAPQLTLTDLSSRKRSLEDYRNSIVLVNNWATWCPPCKAEMPTLQKYYLEHIDQGFLVIAIESGESIDIVSDFIQQNSLTIPVWIDIDGLALEKFNNWDLPSSFLIDRNGRVRLTWTGPITMEMLEKFVTPFLNQ